MTLKRVVTVNKETNKIHCIVAEDDTILEGESNLTLREAEARLYSHVSKGTDCYIGLTEDFTL